MVAIAQSEDALFTPLTSCKPGSCELKAHCKVRSTAWLPQAWSHR